MHKFTLICTILFAGAIVLADGGGDTPAPPPSPQSAAAKDALSKYAAGEKRARDVYDHAEAGLSQDLAAGLKRAKQIALRNSDLDEANRIQANLDAIKKDSAPAAAQTPLARDIAGSAWQIDRYHQTMVYKADGTCVSRPTGTETGTYNGRWQVAGENTIEQVQINGAKTLITFTADRKAAVWQLTGSDGGTAVTAAVRAQSPH